MAGIKAPIQDVLSKLTSMQVLNNELQTVPLYTRIYNNQLARQKDGGIYAFTLPAAFVEVINDAEYNRQLNGVSDSDLTFRIHLAHWFTDAQDGTMEQDLLIFDLRDSVIALLSDYRPTACGNLCLTAEGQDYNHDDVYVYILEFKTNFTDSKGSGFDVGRTDYQNSTPPTALNLQISEVTSL